MVLFGGGGTMKHQFMEKSMPSQTPHGASNVIRFPVELRAAPSMDVLREIAPDSRVVQAILDASDSDCSVDNTRFVADQAMAERIAGEVPAGPAVARRIALKALLAPLVERAIDLSRQAIRVLEEAGMARARAEKAEAEGGYWLLPLDIRARERGDAAFHLLIDAYVASEEAEGAARAVRLALQGEAWHPFDIHAEAEALFFGEGARGAR